MALLYLGSACMQDPEAPHNQPDTPTLSVDEASVTRVSMLVNGSFGHDLTDITSYGVELSEALFDAGGEVRALVPQEVGADGYALGVSGLSPNETYYLRAFISNGHSKMYSSVVTQKTPETSVASVSDAVLSADGAYVTATLEDNGGRSVEEVGFVWGEQNDRRAIRREKRYPATLSDDGKSFKLPVSYIGKGTHYVLAYAEDNKEATGFSRIALERIVRDDEPLPEFQPANEIWYTSTDGEVVPVNQETIAEFGVNLVSNVYADGKGIIAFDGPLTVIATSAFRNCPTLETVSLAGTQITDIYWGGFMNCSSLKSISLPTGLKKLGGYALYGTAISSIELPSTLEYIDHDAFASCPRLEEITIPESVNYISPVRAFGDRTPIKAFYGKGATADHACLIMDDCLVGIANKDQELDFVIPDGVKTLGSYLFDFWCNFKSITFPSSLEVGSESMSSFSSPQRLSAFYGSFVSEDNRCLIINNEMLGFAFYNLGASSYTIPAGVKVMGEACMYNQNNNELKTLILPEGVESVKQSFIGLTSIESVELPSSLKEIDDKAFFAAYDLKRLTVPASVESIGSLAFQAAGYEATRQSARPSSLQIEPRADDANGMTDITFLSATPPAIQPDTFDQMVYDCPLYVPSSAVDTYKSATNWSKYAERIMAIPADWKPNHYLTFTSEGTTKLSLTNHYNNAPVLYYSRNTTDWNVWDYSELTFSSDAPVYICGDNPDGFDIDINTYSSFSSTGDPFSVSGDIMSLINNQESVTIIPKEGCFRGLFFGTNIVSPPSLPATTLAYGCYYQMFYACPNLASAPELPATTMAEGCYWQMFRDCTSLTTPPTLPATSMEGGCYRDMFYGCSSLNTAPELPATKLAGNCYNAMFYGCSSLTSPPELPATIMEKGCYANMFAGCGNLTSAPDLPSTSLAEDCYASMFSSCIKLATIPSRLPATTLAKRCYSSMFYYCLSIETAPEIPATTLDEYCCSRMFDSCEGLKTAPDLPATSVAEGCYSQMFSRCSSLTTAPSILPATTLANSCFSYMFNGCTSLKTAPALPATTLAKECYMNMFASCTSLETAPDLPATNLADMCYREMFTGCAIAEAPVLRATTLTLQCYYWMFYGCSNLSNVKCMATDINYSECTYNWLYGVASQGTFVKAANMNDWPSGANGIPEGWTVLNDDGTAPIAPSKYLTFTSEGTTKLSLSNQGYAPVLYYSFDTTSWTQWDYGELSFAADKPLYICGDNTNGLCPDSNVHTVNVFTASGDLFAVSGDIMSLLNKDEDMTAIPGNPGSSAITSCFYGLFRDCTILTSGPSLPASQLTPLCYSYMFSGCTALKVAPELPATIISTRCYDHMFEGCSALTEAPALSANSLATGCYANMFQDCTGLSSAPELPATTLTGYCYDNMFQGCTRLTAAPVLPATAIDMYSYRGMFSGCTSLVTPPELPATTFKSFECYEEMFKGCTSLATAPALPVTELTNGCYANMFKDCTSLRTAPELPAEVLVRNCYYGMFENCSKLNYVKCLVKEVNDSANLNRWLYGVASSGTFVKSAQASNWPAGSSGIPEGWAVVNDGDTPSGGNEGTGEEDWN